MVTALEHSPHRLLVWLHGHGLVIAAAALQGVAGRCCSRATRMTMAARAVLTSTVDSSPGAVTLGGQAVRFLENLNPTMPAVRGPLSWIAAPGLPHVFGGCEQLRDWQAACVQCRFLLHPPSCEAVSWWIWAGLCAPTLVHAQHINSAMVGPWVPEWNFWVGVTSFLAGVAVSQSPVRGGWSLCLRSLFGLVFVPVSGLSLLSPLGQALAFGSFQHVGRDCTLCCRFRTGPGARVPYWCCSPNGAVTLHGR